MRFFILLKILCLCTYGIPTFAANAIDCRALISGHVTVSDLLESINFELGIERKKLIERKIQLPAPVDEVLTTLVTKLSSVNIILEQAVPVSRDVVIAVAIEYTWQLLTSQDMGIIIDNVHRAEMIKRLKARPATFLEEDSQKSPFLKDIQGINRADVKEVSVKLPLLVASHWEKLGGACDSNLDLIVQVGLVHLAKYVFEPPRKKVRRRTAFQR